MTILVTGTTGFVGGAVITELLLQKRKAKAIVRTHKHSFKQATYVDAINAKTDFSQALEGCTTVIHSAARVHVMNDTSASPLEDFREVNTRGTVNLAKQAAAAGIKRFIFISSIKVNGEATVIGQPFTTQDPRSPEDDYGQSKSEAELQLLEIAATTAMEVVIIRPCLIYGPGVKANFAALMNLVSKGLPLPFGCITDNRRSMVSLTNLVDLIIRCIDHPKAANQVFLASDDHDLSTAELVSHMAKALNKPIRLLPIPLFLYRLAGKILAKQAVIDRLLGSLQVDITHTKTTLDWQPPQTIEDGLKQTADAFLQDKS